MSTHGASRRSTLALLAIAAAGLSGCGGSGTSPGGNVLAPQFQPQVINAVDDFQFQATGVTGVTQTLNYAWRNTGVQANVNQSCSITGGSATLVLTDSTGAQVYSRNLGDNGTFQSTAGAPSAWGMQIVLTNVTGTVNFRSQKKT
jgi:hypothetical protein